MEWEKQGVPRDVASRCFRCRTDLEEVRIEQVYRRIGSEGEPFLHQGKVG